MFLSRLMYEGSLRHESAQALFGKNFVYTSPHNGGVHSFIVLAREEDVTAFLSLIEEEHGHKKGCAEFLAFARGKLN